MCIIQGVSTSSRQPSILELDAILAIGCGIGLGKCVSFDTLECVSAQVFARENGIFLAGKGVSVPKAPVWFVKAFGGEKANQGGYRHTQIHTQMLAKAREWKLGYKLHTTRIRHMRMC